MNVSREVVTDLLPVYFSGEASKDTTVLVEDYFHQDPDFERVARSAATPLDTLRAAAPIAPAAEKEKRDLQSILWGLRRRQWLFAVSLFLTLVPLSFHSAQGHFVSLVLRDSPWYAAFEWSLAAALWFLYFARLPRRTNTLMGAIFLTLIPAPFVLHYILTSARSTSGEFAGSICIWVAAAFVWFSYFRQRPC